MIILPERHMIASGFRKGPAYVPGYAASTGYSGAESHYPAHQSPAVGSFSNSPCCVDTDGKYLPHVVVPGRHHLDRLATLRMSIPGIKVWEVVLGIASHAQTRRLGSAG